MFFSGYFFSSAAAPVPRSSGPVVHWSRRHLVRGPLVPWSSGLSLSTCSFCLVVVFCLSALVLFCFSARLLRFSVPPGICFFAVPSAFCLCLLIVFCLILLLLFCFSSFCFAAFMMRSYAPPLFCLSASLFIFHPHPSRRAPL